MSSTPKGETYQMRKDLRLPGLYTWSAAHQLDKGRFREARLDKTGRPSVSLLPGQHSGVWESPLVEFQPLQRDSRIVPSWLTSTPRGSYVRVKLRVRCNGELSDWYDVADWAHHNTALVTRTSFPTQSNDTGKFDVDTYFPPPRGKLIDACQLRFELYGSSSIRPQLFQAAFQVCKPNTWAGVSVSTVTESKVLELRGFPQFPHDGEYPEYGGGGNVWCSPAGLTPILEYYGVGPTQADIDALPFDSKFEENGRVDGELDCVVAEVFDLEYGAGNWAFAVAAAGERGLDAVVCQLPSLQYAERLVVDYDAPLTISAKWKKGDFPASMLPESNGHLFDIIGFNEVGDVIVLDSATVDENHREVKKLLPREALERVLMASGGMAYRILPL